MPEFKFSEAGKQKMINQLLDAYNGYLELHQMLGDIHFKQEAERILEILEKHFSKKRIGDEPC